jgi:hypothetical protein
VEKGDKILEIEGVAIKVRAWMNAHSVVSHAKCAFWH